MRGSGRPFLFVSPLLMVSMLCAAFCAAPLARAASVPSDPCSLLSAADVSKAVGKTYGAPQSSTAPRPFATANTGTDCKYAAQGSGDPLLFRIYFDNSPAQASDLHARLKQFFSPATPVSGVSDEAYFDPKHAIHVRKGGARYFLQLNGDGSAEKPLKDLAVLVSGKL